MTTERAAIVAELAASKSLGDYNRIIDEMKKGFGGQYPKWYWEAVVTSGLSQRKADEFAGHATPDVTALKVTEL